MTPWKLHPADFLRGAVRTKAGLIVTATTVQMDRADFEKEHTHLPKVLVSGTPLERAHEAKEQAEELKEVQAVPKSKEMHVTEAETGRHASEGATHVAEGHRTEQSGSDGQSGQDIIRGSTNIPLSPKGTQQAAQLAERFKAKGGLDEMFSSDFDRALQTATPIAKASGIQVHPTKSLHPMYWGGAEGRPTQQVLGMMNSYIDKHPDKKLPGKGKGSTLPGESFNTFKQRALTGMDWLIQRYESSHPDVKIGATSHYRVAKLVEAWAKAGFPEPTGFHPRSKDVTGKTDPPGSVHRIFLDDKGKRQMQPVEMQNSQPLKGGVYLIRHGLTAYNSENAGPLPSNEVSK